MEFCPGIATIDHVASDVHDSHLAIQAAHHEVGIEGIDTVLLNSKGFGGNNASAVLMGPHVANQLMLKKHGAKAMQQTRPSPRSPYSKPQPITIYRACGACLSQLINLAITY